MFGKNQSDITAFHLCEKFVPRHSGWPPLVWPPRDGNHRSPEPSGSAWALYDRDYAIPEGSPEGSSDASQDSQTATRCLSEKQRPVMES